MLLANVAFAAVTTDGPDFTGRTETAFVPYATKMNFDDLQGMNARVSINGGPVVRLQVDTGSVGIIVGSDVVPNIAPDAEPGSITYSSSGISLVGV